MFIQSKLANKESMHLICYGGSIATSKVIYSGVESEKANGDSLT